MKTVAVVGTSLAGLRAAQELRSQGFDGELVLIGAEAHRPYDRPPLSKEFLLGKVSAADLALADAEDLDALQATWLLGAPAISLSNGLIILANGRQVVADGVVIATGGTPKTLAGSAELTGVHTLRTLDDAVALRTALSAGPSSVVVIGAGFIGAEVASSCRLLGHDVTVVEALPVPLAGVLGEQLGAVCAELHADNGVPVRTGTGVAGLVGTDRVTGVRLTDGTELPADLVVAGIGVRPVTEWLTGSGLAVDDGVLVDSGCVTADPRVVAIGDVARYWSRPRGRRVRSEHWTAATEQPAIAVRNLLAGSTVAHYERPGYFWSDQYGCRIQFAGTVTPQVRIVEGELAERKFVAAYVDGDAVVGVLALDSARGFGKLRRGL
ncbi:NAD(P)/FAD-dependent oxidoreductase [Amycolatopsis sp. H20-H5]|uniref:NAD(P)/FAD-dependent oxidoreductase n=1 Tax=Amycolatopsis sp. H20-H5 TaxID=3046309 RepID=UPI002DBC252B|nr:FAD-dependent oxidoreductase [Amycolatopsis sp. H20-H5]MEC3982085.1 FAD-dependent oxidoreductase [Amycolatopsis sp. H20-H5]